MIVEIFSSDSFQSMVCIAIIWGEFLHFILFILGSYMTAEFLFELSLTITFMKSDKAIL